ncbi:MAG: aminotransferase class I/II-fold pyridoxal phosphate-dependent enzyme [Planctomycetes bacterium]|nr:aminotransferase class I/II-fold pyridoxal phosphate-dependent enzyme [Planctomycetota bacterium]
MAVDLEELGKCLDLRSDTATIPNDAMWQAMHRARVGDGGRTDLTGRGEDPTVYALERRAAELTGKDDAIFLPTGSLANHLAMYTAADRGDKVLVERTAHIYIDERSDFMPRYGGLVPIFYRLTDDYQIDRDELAYLLGNGDITVLCLENTHNFSGGTCLTPETTRQAAALARAAGVHVHLDGARIFNAAVALGVDVVDLVAPVDSLMFCISKGLGAPVGSLLVGSAAFIERARVCQKLQGTFMRQAGVIAAAGLVALEEGFGHLATDHAHAALLASLTAGVAKAVPHPASGCTNFVYFDVSPTGLSATEVAAGLRRRGLLVAAMTDSGIRLATYRGISRHDVERAAAILLDYFASL